MDQERLILLLEDPRRATEDDLAALRGLAERYPYFQAAHLLLSVAAARAPEAAVGPEGREAWV
ncbi:MAG: hypothetical protein WBA12_09680, partial [Catalinimonas sp.]